MDTVELRDESLHQEPMMAHLLDSLDPYFLSGDEVISELVKSPDFAGKSSRYTGIFSVRENCTIGSTSSPVRRAVMMLATFFAAGHLI